MGINLGGLIGPLIAGKLAEGVDWHLGFAWAGVGMTLGLVQYVLGRNPLQPASARPAARPEPAAAASGAGGAGSTAAAWQRTAARGLVFPCGPSVWGATRRAACTVDLARGRSA